VALSGCVTGVARELRRSTRAERDLELIGLPQDVLGFFARQATVCLGFQLHEAAMGSIHQGKQQVKMNLRESG
jgi:hypothetical protein